MATIDKYPVIKIYTDGACNPNPGDGGWAAILFWNNGKQLELSGSATNTTNNRMELTAIIEALKILEDRFIVDLYSDSQYCEKVLINHHTSANQDLIAELDELKHKHKIHFCWIRSGSNPENIRADGMAKAAINHPDNSGLDNYPLVKSYLID